MIKGFSFGWGETWGFLGGGLRGELEKNFWGENLGLGGKKIRG